VPALVAAGGHPEIDATVWRENLIRLDGLPFVAKVTGAPTLNPGDRMRVAVEDIDLLDIDLTCRYLAQLTAPEGTACLGRRPPYAPQTSADWDDRFTKAVLFSAILHVLVIFGMQFTGRPTRSCSRTRHPPLDVVLVNAKTTDKPLQADVLAQANLDGGGNVEEDRQAIALAGCRPGTGHESPRRSSTRACRPWNSRPRC
jgi:hypothetical protein